MILAVDPGSHSGGAALVTPSLEVVAWWSWVQLKRKGHVVYRLRGSSSPQEPSEYADLHQVGQAVADAMSGPYVLVVEGLFVSRASKKALQSVLPLAESAGLVMGPLLELAQGDVLRPLAQPQWRRVVLGLPQSTNDKAAEAYAVEHARRAFGWATPPPTATYAEEGAVCEAACMAQWALLEAA